MAATPAKKTSPAGTAGTGVREAASAYLPQHFFELLAASTGARVIAADLQGSTEVVDEQLPACGHLDLLGLNA